MKLTGAVIFLVGSLAAVCSGLPASKKDDVEEITSDKNYGGQPIVDTGVFSGWDSPFSNPFGGLFDNLEGIMETMRRQIASLLNKFPTDRNSTEDIPAGFGKPDFPDIGGIDLSKGNTTSITKVIDGHTVVINETEYKDQNDFGGTFFKVRIIDVKPDSSDMTTDKEAEPVTENATPKDREEIGDSIENEISKSREAEVKGSVGKQDTSSLYDNLQKTGADPFQNLETFDEVASFEDTDNTPTTFTHPNHETNSIESLDDRFSTNDEWTFSKEPVETEWSYINPVKTLDSNTIEFTEKEDGRQNPIDLSRDTYVNEILTNKGAPINPDAEVFVVENIKRSSPFGGHNIIDPR